MPWLPWILLLVALGVGGLAVVAVLCARVYMAIRDLRRQVEDSRRRLEPKLTELEETSARVRMRPLHGADR